MLQKFVILKCVACIVFANVSIAESAEREPTGITSKPTGITSNRSSLGNRVVPLTADSIYQGWRASRVLGAEMISMSDQKLGVVRNILVDINGKINALVVEGGASEFVYRVPWAAIDAAKLPGKIVANIEIGAQLKLVPDDKVEDGSKKLTEFPVTQVVGDYARLQAGLAYGYVSDVVFSPSANMLAVLVLRDAAAGRGLYAFGFPGTIGRWDPSAGYYGLPYVTTDQANAAAIRVDPMRF